jgi:hypothetical protein
VEKSYLNEGSAQEEAVREADLNTTKKRGYASAVHREVRKVVGDNGGGGDGGLKHANERIAVDGLNHLLLQLKQSMR